MPTTRHASSTAASTITAAADASQGRVTVATIMAGAVAKKLLSQFDVDVLAYTRSIGKIKMEKQLGLGEIRKNRYESAVRCPDLACAEKMEDAILDAKKAGESLGGVIECIASKCSRRSRRTAV